MADPISIVSLTLGAASFAIQIFDGVKRGYEYFEYAANMLEECASFKLRLRIEYSRLIDWADVAGLSDEKNHEKFDKKFVGNRHLILAVLSEMNALFVVLQKDYQELKWDEDEMRPLEKPEDATRDQTAVLDPQSSPGTNITFQLTGVDNKLASSLWRKQNIDDIDLGAYSIFQSSNVPKRQQKRTKGLNHIMSFGKKVSNVASQPRCLKWAAIDRERYYEKLAKLTQLTDYLHQTMGDHQLDLLTQSTRENCLAMLQLTESVQEMKDLLAGARIVKITDVDVDSDYVSIFSQAATLVDLTENQTHDFKAHGTLFERLVQFSISYVETSTADSRVGTRLETPQIDFQEDNAVFQRTMAIFEGKNVWIEWKDYEASAIILLGSSIFYAMS